jgi:hypothetical protein
MTLQLERLIALRQMLIERSSQLHNHSAMLIERSSQLHNHSAMLIERSSQLHNHSAMLIEWSSQLHNHSAMLIERSSQLHNHSAHRALFKPLAACACCVSKAHLFVCRMHICTVCCCYPARAAVELHTHHCCRQHNTVNNWPDCFFVNLLLQAYNALGIQTGRHCARQT